MNTLADRKFSDKNVQIIMVNLANFLQENTSPNSCDNINKMLFKRYQLFWNELSLKLEAFYVSIFLVFICHCQSALLYCVLLKFKF